MLYLSGLTEGSGEEGWSSNSSSGYNTTNTTSAANNKNNTIANTTTTIGTNITMNPQHNTTPADATTTLGQTPYTLSVKFCRGNRGFGFSVTWTRPPRVERVEAGLPAAVAGLQPGDYIIFVGSHNIVRMEEKEIMNIIR